jgi:hypothetical protein
VATGITQFQRSVFPITRAGLTGRYRPVKKSVPRVPRPTQQCAVCGAREATAQDRAKKKQLKSRQRCAKLRRPRAADLKFVPSLRQAQSMTTPQTPTPGNTMPPFRPPTCLHCAKDMHLVSVVPHQRFVNLDVRNFACDCGETARDVVARLDS